MGTSKRLGGTELQAFTLSQALAIRRGGLRAVSTAEEAAWKRFLPSRILDV